MLGYRLGLGAAVAASLALAAPAAAATYELVGRQTVVDADAGTFRMSGDLVGLWEMTSFEQLDTSPLLEAKGTDRFLGCVDRRGDRSCAGDPSGTLSFTFRYWAQMDAGDPAALVWGACWHPVVEGTGAFAGARGVIVFADTPTAPGVRTAYVGNLTLGAKRSRTGGARRARAATAASTRTGCGGRA